MKRVVAPCLLALALLVVLGALVLPARSAKSSPAAHLAKVEMPVSGYFPAAYIHVEAHWPYVYAFEEHSLTIFDGSHPAHPQVVSRRFFPQELKTPILIWPHLYILTGDQKLIALDVQHPESKGYIFHPPGMGYDLPVDAEHAVRINDGFLQICQSANCVLVKLNGKAAPELSAWNGPRMAAVYDGYGYTIRKEINSDPVRSEHYVDAYNLADPYLPVLASSVMVFSYTSGDTSNIISLTAAGNTLVAVQEYCYMFCEYSIYKIDTSNPDGLTLAGDKQHYSSRSGDVYSFQDTFFFVEDYYSRLWQVDATDPYTLQEVNRITTTFRVDDLAADGDLLAAIGDQGMSFFPLTPPISYEAAHTPTLGLANSLAVQNDYAYAAAPSEGWVSVLDLHASPVISVVSRVDLDLPQDAWVRGPVLYTYDAGCTYAKANTCWYTFRALDLLDPDNPVAIGEADVLAHDGWGLDAVRTDLAFSGDTAFLLIKSVEHYYPPTGVTHLAAIDLSQPISPTLLGSWAGYPYPSSLAVAGSLAYLATPEDGLWLLDVSDPSITPTLLATTTLGGALPGAADILLQGSLAYLASGSRGVQILDVSDPYSITLVGQLDTPGSASELLLEGSWLYVLDGEAGLRVIDVSDPTAPVEIAFFDNLLGQAAYVAVTEDHIYLGQSQGGVFIFSLPIQTDRWEMYLPVAPVNRP